MQSVPIHLDGQLDWTQIVSVLVSSMGEFITEFTVRRPGLVAEIDHWDVTWKDILVPHPFPHSFLSHFSCCLSFPDGSNFPPPHPSTIFLLWNQLTMDQTLKTMSWNKSLSSGRYQGLFVCLFLCFFPIMAGWPIHKGYNSFANLTMGNISQLINNLFRLLILFLVS